jgi:hypothetical protein
MIQFLREVEAGSVMIYLLLRCTFRPWNTCLNTSLTHICCTAVRRTIDICICSGHFIHLAQQRLRSNMLPSLLIAFASLPLASNRQRRLQVTRNVMNTFKRAGKCSGAVCQSTQPLVSGEQHVVFQIIGMLMVEFLSHNTLAPMVHACKLLQEDLRFKQSRTWSHIQMHNRKIIMIAVDFHLLFNRTVHLLVCDSKLSMQCKVPRSGLQRDCAWSMSAWSAYLAG